MATLARIRHDIVTSLDLGSLRQRLRERGMGSLREDAWAKVQAGITTVEEVLRVVDG